MEERPSISDLLAKKEEDKLTQKGNKEENAVLVTDEDPEYELKFTLYTDGKMLSLMATSREERMEWIVAIKVLMDIKQSRDAMSETSSLTSTNTVSSKISYSKKPLINRVINAACVVPKAFKMSHWGRGNDIRAAVKYTKETLKIDASSEALFHDGEGVDGMINRYEVCRRLGLERTGIEYSNFGYYMALEGLVHKVLMRYKMTKYLAENPAITSLSLGDKQPIVVVGLNGSGEYELHTLLSIHSKLQVHYTWEQLDPVPDLPCTASKSEIVQEMQTKYQANKKNFQRVMYIGGIGNNDINSLHALDYDAAEECTIPCAMGLPWSVFEIPFNAFAAKEVMDMGAGDGYELYKKYLQLLLWKNDSRSPSLTWLLHSPHHLAYLQELHTTFPGILLVWTHRDPVYCILYICSLYDAILQLIMTPESINRHAIGIAVFSLVEESLQRAEESIEILSGSNGLNLIHVRFPEKKFDASKMKELCKRIIDHHGMEYTEQFSTGLDDQMKATVDIDVSPVDESDEQLLAKYGLLSKQIRDEFDSYIRKYIIPSPDDNSYLLWTCATSKQVRDRKIVDEKEANSSLLVNLKFYAAKIRKVLKRWVRKNDPTVVLIVVMLIFNGIISVVSTFKFFSSPVNLVYFLAIGNVIIAASVMMLGRNDARHHDGLTGGIRSKDTQEESSKKLREKAKKGAKREVVVDPLDWKEKLTGKWVIHHIDNFDDWGMLFDMNFLIRRIAKSKFMTLMKTISVEKHSLAPESSTGYIFHLDRSFGGTSNKWQFSGVIAKSRQQSVEVLTSMSSKDDHIVRTWSDEEQKKVFMECDPVDKDKGVRVLHSRQLIPHSNELLMEWEGYNFATKKTGGMTTRFLREEFS